MKHDDVASVAKGSLGCCLVGFNCYLWSVFMDKNQKTFSYGYLIAASCFSIQAIGVGIYVAYGVFFNPLIAEFGWSRTIISGASSVAFLIIFKVAGSTLGSTSGFALGISFSAIRVASLFAGR